MRVWLWAALFVGLLVLACHGRSLPSVPVALTEGQTYRFNQSCPIPEECYVSSVSFTLGAGQYLLKNRNVRFTLTNRGYGCALLGTGGAPCLLGSAGPITMFLDSNTTLSVEPGATREGQAVLQTEQTYYYTIQPPTFEIASGAYGQWWAGSITVEFDNPVPWYGTLIFCLIGVFAVVVAVIAWFTRDTLPMLFSQFRVVMWKNFVLSYRIWGLTALQIVPGVCFVIFLLILAVVPHFTNPIFPNPKIVDVGPIPKCTPVFPSKDPFCISLAFAPSDDSRVMELMQLIADASNLTLHQRLSSNSTSISTRKKHSSSSSSSSSSTSSSTSMTGVKTGAIVGFRTPQEMQEYILDHVNGTQAAVVFTLLHEGTESSKPRAAYNIWWNNSYFQPFAKLTVRFPDIRLPVQANVDAAIFQTLFPATPSADVKVLTKRFPEVTLTDFLQDPVRIYGGLFFFCGALFPFVVLLYQLAFEKDNKLKLGMMMIGLRGPVYWASWLATTLIFNLLGTLLLIATGAAAQFAFFLQTNFFVLLLVFSAFELAMVFLGMFISVFVNTVKQAVTVGMLLFIIGALVQMFCISPYFISIIYDPDYRIARVLKYVLSFYPPFHFAKMFYDISLRSFSVGSALKGPGYTWADLYQPAPLNFQGVELPPTIANIYWLLVDSLIFLVLAWYFENVMPSGTGTAQSPIFFLTPRWWGCRQASSNSKGTTGRYETIGEALNDEAMLSAASPGLDSDVIDEGRRARSASDEEDQSIAVRIVDLRKTYHKYPFGIASKSDVQAVKGISYCVDRNSVLCLLGHNGSGKSTTIGLLTGLFEPSGDVGDAFVFGESVRRNPHGVRKLIGVCPQHDILWDALTAYEHLRLFAKLRNVPDEDVEALVQDKLRGVSLLPVQHMQASTYSGGMKRRLSVAISSIGDPPLIIMDEPTTGMDPKSVQHVWHMIQEMKRDRSILLTTHSMEEAELLADRIAIMSAGEIKCIGSSLHLKNKYGDGYQLTMSVRYTQVNEIRQFVLTALPEAQLVSQTGELLTFALPVGNGNGNGNGGGVSSERVIGFLHRLEQLIKESPETITDWGISMPTLDSVFTRVTKPHGDSELLTTNALQPLQDHDD